MKAFAEGIASEPGYWDAAAFAKDLARAHRVLGQGRREHGLRAAVAHERGRAMFLLPAPEVRDTEVFTRMPERFRRTGVRSDWADANRGGQPTDSFLEGPVFDAAGNLYVTDIPFGRIFRIDPSGEWEQVAEWDGEPNGMKFLNDRELLVTDYRNGLMVCDIASGTVRPYLERRNSERFKGVNDLMFDSRGNLYFTDQGQTGLHDPTGPPVPAAPGRPARPAARATCRARTAWRCRPTSACCISASRAATRSGACRCWTTAASPRSARSSRPTARAVPTAWRWTSKGRLIVANPGLGVAWVLNHRAEPEVVLRSCAGASLTNVAFGGADRKTLYCTESVSGSVLRAALDAARPAAASPAIMSHRGTHGQ